VTAAARDGEAVFAEWLEVMRERMQQDHLRVLDLFRECDRNSDGKVSREELGQFLASCGHPMSAGDMRLVMAAMDADGSGMIDYHEFSQRVYRKRFGSRSIAASADSVAPAPPLPAAPPEAAGDFGAATYTRWLGEMNSDSGARTRGDLLALLRRKDIEGTGAVTRQAFRAALRECPPPKGALSARESNALIAYLDPQNTMHVVYDTLPVAGTTGP
jgi:hypothetical protein